MTATPVLEMRHIAKAFGKFYALKGVDLTVWPGEIHALMGENGAGKSTLMKILAGAYTATSGEILIDGKPQTIRGPKDALAAGITLIYQEMQLAPNLTVAENIFLGSELARGGLVQRKAMLSQAQAVIDRLGAQFKASDRVMTLTIAEQQQVEIARALHRQSRILVMDEPTAALSSRETQRLFELILRLRDEGMAIIYPGTYVRPHRHPHTFELLLPLRGRFVVLNFDDRGTVTHRAILGETCTVLEMAAGTWHAVLSLDTGGIIFEVKHGGYQPVAADDYAHWAPAEGEPGTTELMAWYAQAQVGDSTFAV
ncbi:sugar ABC transporter ATP-binding protein [Klebsiella pneumoniae]|nr:sugar ABC transporter ATP-binding protein [Klebsiella pneumoniae]